MANIHVQLSSLRELRHTLGQLRLNKLTVDETDGIDLLSPFAAKTGRNQPSSNAFIFGQSVRLRGLIKPAEGMAVAYIDWSAQEIAIAAALSGDANLWQAHRSGDPYIDFAIRAGLVPNDDQQSHRRERSLQAALLGIGYGMTEEASPRGPACCRRSAPADRPPSPDLPGILGMDQSQRHPRPSRQVAAHGLRLAIISRPTRPGGSIPDQS